MYASESLALAALEYLVHVDPAELPGDLAATQAEIPDAVAFAEIRVGDLPPDWRGYPAPEALAQLGTAWAAGRATAVLAIPSAVIPAERNYLLNPHHPEFTRIRIGKPHPFALDPRLLRR